MTTTNICNMYDFDALTKTVLSKIAGKLGLKGDWARETKENLIILIEGHDEESVLQALRDVGATEDDIENLRMAPAEVVISAQDAISAMMEGENTNRPASTMPATLPLPKTAAMAAATVPPHAAKPAIMPAAMPTTTPANAPARTALPTAPAAPATAPAEKVTQLANVLASLLPDSAPSVDTETITAIAQQVTQEGMQTLKEQIAENMHTALGNMLEMAKASLADLPARKLEVTSKNGTVTIPGLQHKQFDLLLKVLGSCDMDGNNNLNVWLTGMPGTGKTRAAANAAQALGMPFYCNGSIANKYELLGFTDAHGKYQSTPFRDAWEKGGVYLFDEVDGSVPSAVLAFNSALANGIVAFPDGMIKRHKDCIIIAAANTNGQGATAEMVGRMKQDAAFLDRFVFLQWDIDEDLERHLTQNDEWLQYVHKIRRAVETKGIKVMITPRASLYGAQLLACGIDRKTVITMTLKKGMSDAQWNMVA